jgi:hypothetical protein
MSNSALPTALEIDPSTSRLTPNCGALRMIFQVRMNGILIRHCRLIDNRNGRRPWISPPVEIWKDTNGKQNYLPLCEFPPDVKLRLLDLALIEYDRIARGENEQ